MKALIISIVTFFVYAGAHAQKEAVQADRMLKTEDGNLYVVIQKDGKCAFTYQNGMSTKKDERIILFKNKKDIGNFEKRISKALVAKDGTSDIVIYKTYKIRLLTEIDGVFMIVNEPGQMQSTLRISKEMYSQVNRL
jgi:hypothetical protein